MCIQQCDPERLLRLYLQCFGSESALVPTPAEKAAFRMLLDSISTVIPEETDCCLGAKPISGQIPDIYMTDSQNQEYGLLLTDWGKILGLHVNDQIMTSFLMEYLMAAVLYEMTWFGMTADENSEIAML